MNKHKKFINLAICLLFILIIINSMAYTPNITYSNTIKISNNHMINISYVSAETDITQNTEIKEDIYKIYDETDSLIMERQSVEINDIIIDKNFNQFEIVEVDDNNHTAHCVFKKSLPKPKVIKNDFSNIADTNITKKIGVYMTHNDESYETGDGYDSVYGKGGIHDIAKLLVNNLQTYGVTTYFDESLHIPHDSYAYSRSKNTAESLLKNDLDAIFDIHRDGASRKTYVKNIDGVDRCKVRIVVGQANKNKDDNLNFALNLMSVAEKICPWLFLDIYYAKGHYNQNLKNTSLLFEMGSHLVEKNLVEKTVPYLANVINTTLYKTSIDENNNLVINPTNINENIATNYKTERHNNYLAIILIFVAIAIVICFVFYKIIKLQQKRH